MKYVVIGLGYFGSKVATLLTAQGHEVIGIDSKADRLEEVKESVTMVMRMDTTSINAVSSLPLNDTDAVIVTIGEDVGASILTLSILKNMNAKRIIGRAINQTHQNILAQIGIEEIILPLEDSAYHLCSMLQIRNVIRLTEISDDHAVAEIMVPARYTGHMIETASIQDRFSLKIVAIKRASKGSSFGSIFSKENTIELFFKMDDFFREKDILLLAGRISDIKRFAESQ